MRSLLIPMIILAAGFGGCLSGPEPAPTTNTGPQTTNNTTIDWSLQTPLLTKCTEFHTFSYQPAMPFASFVPSGFSIKTEDPANAVFELGVHVEYCSGGITLNGSQPSSRAEVGQLWVLIPVNVPSQHANIPGITQHFVPVVALVANQTLWRIHEAWGLASRVHVANSSASLVADNQAAYSEQFSIYTADERYDMTVAAARNGGAWGALKNAIWVPTSTGVAGYVVANHSSGQSIGLGGASLRYTGSGGAPPLTPEAAHLVTGTRIDYHFVSTSATVTANMTRQTV
jgi:hypothetical protein